MSRGKSRLTFLEAAKAVLEEMKQPMHFKKITELALQKKYLRSKGKTPEWTMGARLSVDVKEKGRSSDFIRTDNGKYGLRRWKQSVKSPHLAHLGAHQEGEQQFWLIAVEPRNFDSDYKNDSFYTAGVRHRMRRTLARLEPNDYVVIYIKKDAQFGAILKVEGESYIEESQRWPVKGEELSARIDVSPITVLPPEKRIDARPLYASLDVFTQYPEKHRTLALRNGITEISESDFEKIKREFESASA